MITICPNCKARLNEQRAGMAFCTGCLTWVDMHQDEKHETGSKPVVYIR